MKCLAFDLGRVVFDFDYSRAINRMEGRIGVSLGDIIDALFYKDFGADFERGLVDASNFYSKFIETFKANISFGEFKSIWCEIFWPKKEVIEFIEKLSSVYRVYLISNINELHFSYLYGKWREVFSLFDELVLSFKVGQIKPHPKIYQELSKVSNSPYEDIVYIDDREDLIKEAEKLGLRTIRFNGLDELTVALEEYDIFCPSYKETEFLKELKKRIDKSKSILLVGMGNELRSDDIVGSSLIDGLNGKLTIEILNVGESLENYLGKIRDCKADLVIFFDVASYDGEERFRFFSIEEIDNHFYLTHDTSLQLAAKYLQRNSSFDILIFGIKGYNFFLGNQMSRKTQEAKCIIEDFFITNFSKGSRKK